VSSHCETRVSLITMIREHTEHEEEEEEEEEDDDEK
jgi:hypothetical protein